MTKANLATVLKENKQLMKVNVKQLSILRSLSVLVNGVQTENKKLNNNKTSKSVGNDASGEINKLKKKSADVHMEIPFLLNLLIDMINQFALYSSKQHI